MPIDHDPKANILLVDDNLANLLALEAILDNLGHNLVKARSGAETLKMLMEQDFAAVLLDVQMPGLEGFATARLIRSRERSRHTPIIFLTAHDDNRLMVEEAYSLGAVDYLVKPFVPVILRAKVATFLDLFDKTEQLRRMERREFERKLAEENARWRALVEHSSDAVSLIRADGTVIYSSPANRRVLGYEPGEIISRNGFEFVHPDDQERVAALLAELVQSPGNPVTAELRALHRDGSWRWVECVGTNLLGEPTVGAIVINFRDIAERKRAESALRESEERFARFMQHLPGLAWIKDLEGRYVFANDAAEKAFIKTRAELYGKTDDEVFPPEVAADFKENDRRAVAKGTGVQVLESLLHEDGILHHSLVSKFPIPDADGNVALVGGMAIDVTEQKRIQAVLEESEFRFRQLAENIHKVFWMSDTHKDEVLYISPAYESVWGRSCQSLYEQPRSFLDAIHPEDQGRVVAQSLERQARGEAADVEYRVVRPDGSVRWVRDRSFPVKDSLGRVYRIAGIAEDITEKKNAEEALRVSEERFRLLTEVMPQLVWSSLPDGQIDYCNPRWLDYTGLRQDQVQGDGWTLAMHPDDRARTMAAWRRATQTGEEYQSELRLRDKGGQDRWFLVRALPLRDDRGRILHWFGTCTDIEDRRQMEGALKEADRRKDEFLAMLAHELRNPLAPIRNAVQVMRLLGSADANLQEPREMIDRQVQQLTRLVDDLLDVSRITRGKITLREEPVDLATVIARAVETSRPLIESNRHKLTVSLSAEAIRVVADPTRLEQVFANLLNNATKYTERGGSIWLEVAVATKPVPCPSSSESSPRGQEVLVRVRDTGFGIPAPVLPQVFDLFMQADRTLDRSQGGLGIGLTLVKRLVEMHGGSVTAHSEGLGKGSEFVVRLPIIQEVIERTAAGQRSRLPVPESLHGLRVLVVDDNKDSANSLALLLRLWGYEVRTAHDGVSALKAAQTYRPQVVLLDIGLPGLDGYEVARQLRQNPTMTSVLLVAVTGYGQESDRSRSREAGFDSHLVKPVELEELQDLLARSATAIHTNP